MLVPRTMLQVGVRSFIRIGKKDQKKNGAFECASKRGASRRGATMEKTMTTEEIIRDLARQDAGNADEHDLWAKGEGLRCIRAWRMAGGNAGDLGVVQAIDDAGEDQAAVWYADERGKLGR